jgi:Ca2+/Na+ antiporter
MSEEAKSPHLQEQMNRVKRSLNQNPFIVFVTCIIGGISLAVGGYFGQPWLIVGVVVFCTCTSFSMFSARNAKEQYRKLIEQLNRQAL